MELETKNLFGSTWRRFEGEGEWSFGVTYKALWTWLELQQLFAPCTKSTKFWRLGRDFAWNMHTGCSASFWFIGLSAYTSSAISFTLLLALYGAQLGWWVLYPCILNAFQDEDLWKFEKIDCGFDKRTSSWIWKYQMQGCANFLQEMKCRKLSPYSHKYVHICLKKCRSHN